MTTLHALRRAYTLSFSELSMLTSVPARRLAEFEYQGHPLSADERHSLAALFGVAEHALEGGFVARQVAQPTLTTVQAQALAAVAAVAALAWSLRLGEPAATHASGRPALAAFGAAAELPLQRFNLSSTTTETPTPEPTATFEPTTTQTTVPTATIAPTATATDVATPAFEPTAMPAAAATAILEPAASATPSAIPQPSIPPTATAPALVALAATSESTAPAESSAPALPEPTKRSIQGFRLVKRPTPMPRLARSSQGKPAKAQQPLAALNVSDAAEPSRCPIVPARGRAVLTQGYGVGTHAPAELWGGVDLAVGGGATEGTTVVATHSGYVQVALDSWPAGNFISITSDTGWRTGYAHLATVVVSSGQYVQAGTPIGTIGSTGSATGPHLHYETWYRGGNLDPSPRLFCR